MSKKTRFKPVQIDIVGPLPESSGHKHVLTVIDQASHYPIAVPLQSTETAEVSRAFEDHWIVTFGQSIPLGLRAQPHLDSDLSPNQQAFGSELTPPPEFASRGTEELDEADFYVQLQKVRDGYAYPPAVHHQHDDGEASGILKKAKFVGGVDLCCHLFNFNHILYLCCLIYSQCVHKHLPHV